MNLNHLRIILFVLICLLASSPTLANTLDATVMHPAIPLLDEQGNHVLDSGNAYSPRMSCGEAGCHDYDSITHAFHIEQGRDETSDDFGAKRGLPQLVGPGYFGGYNCMTGNNPDQLAKKVNASADDFADKGSAGWLQRCAGCHTGGGWMEKDRNGNRYDEVDPATVPEFDGDYYNRGTDENNQSADSSVVSQWDWKKSGVVENDCMQCHADINNMQVFDPAINVEGAPEAASIRSTLRTTKLIKGGHFRYANTAMLEFINLDMTGTNPTNLVTFRKENAGMADNGHGGVSFGFDVTIGADGQPILDWNPAAFDPTTKKVEIPMVRFPATETCYGCHRTAASRRGFYGFGENDAAPAYDEDTGVLVDDYKDDVHFGLDWAEANGETRTMTSCNACHTKNYYREAWANTDLDADHNFPKGNSDMDVRNDLDYQPNAKSCVYCHDDAETPAIPSGHDSMLDAHKVLWTNAGDMRGYSSKSLGRITQTHLDQLSCMTCHINNKVYRGQPMQILYRNRRSEDGNLRVVPYNSKPRYYWKDKNSGRVLTATERNSVFRRVDGVGEIFDPQTGATLATVSTHFSHGSWRFGDPDNYADFVSLKQAYDKVLAMKGVSSPDTALIWSEINNYIMTHNTRPAVDSVQCEECHATKQNGSFSALIKDDSIMGSGNEKVVTTVPDPRLVDEGLIILDLPYMKMDANGVVTENVEDILYYTLTNPSLSRLNADVTSNASGKAALTAKNDVIDGFKPDADVELFRKSTPGLSASEAKSAAAKQKKQAALTALQAYRQAKRNYAAAKKAVKANRNATTKKALKRAKAAMNTAKKASKAAAKKAKKAVKVAAKAAKKSAKLAKKADKAFLQQTKKLGRAIATHEAYLFQPSSGSELVRSIKVITDANSLTGMYLPDVGFSVTLPEGVSASAQAYAYNTGKRSLTSDVFKIEIINSNNERVTSLNGVEFLVRIPYHGAKNPKDIRILVSADGSNWSTIGPSAIVMQQWASEGVPGYVVVKTTQLGYMATANKKGLVTPLCGTDGSCD